MYQSLHLNYSIPTWKPAQSDKHRKLEIDSRTWLHYVLNKTEKTLIMFSWSIQHDSSYEVQQIIWWMQVNVISY